MKRFLVFTPRLKILLALVLDVPGVGAWIGIVLQVFRVPPTPVAASATESIIRYAGIGPLYGAFYFVLPALAFILSASNIKRLKKRDRILGNISIIVSTVLLVLFFLTIAGLS